MPVASVQTNTGVELKYTIDDYILAAEAIRRTHALISRNYTISEVLLVLSSAHGILSLTVHALRAALELQRWHRDITGMAIYLTAECYKHIRQEANDNRP